MCNVFKDVQSRIKGNKSNADGTWVDKKSTILSRQDSDVSCKCSALFNSSF